MRALYIEPQPRSPRSSALTSSRIGGTLRRRHLLAFVVPAVASCALGIDSNEFSRGDGASDAAPLDGTPAADAAEGGLDAGPVGADADASAKPCTAPGDPCADGTIYVGALDGSTLYTTPCDLGQTPTTAGCAGDRQRLPYNNGNTTGTVLVGATSADDGRANTTALVATDADSVTAGKQPHQAAAACVALGLGGHTDFYLPALNELELAYAARAALGGFDDSAGAGFYWTSTETHAPDSSLNAARFDFSLGSAYLDGDGKPSPAMVRCFRRTP